MNGRHPIDDLFARGLRDAEATPPPAVWEGVVRKRTVGYRALQRLRKHRGLSVLLFLLFCGAAGYWTLLDTGNGRHATVASTPATVDATTPLSEPDRPASDANAPSRPGLPADATPVAVGQIPTGTPSVVRPTANKAKNTLVTKSDADDDHPRSSVNAMASRDDDRSSDRAGILMGAGVHVPDPSRPGAGSLLSNSYSMRAQGVLEGDASAFVPQTSDDLPPTHITPQLPSLPSPSLRTALAPGQVSPLYVLPKGEWWIGAQAALSGLTNAHWTGNSPLTHDLNASETWLDQREVGIMGGWRWKNGVSIGTGVGIAQERSRFLTSESLPGSPRLVVDTSWTGTAAGFATVYTWNIDSFLVEEPGVQRKYRASNTYTLLRIPLEVGYHKEWRRWSIGARAGVVIATTIGRNGYSLVTAASPADSLGTATTYSRVIDLQDATIDDRFALSLAITGSLDLGYMLSEHFTVRLAPVWSHDLGSGTSNNPHPVADRAGVMLRLEYGFPSHAKRLN